MAHKIMRFGWQPDLPDQRDFAYKTPAAFIKALPSKVDLRKSCPPVYNQGDLGSCTANAIGAAFEFEVRKQNMSDDFVPSRLFIYYNERAMEHTLKSDSGAQIRDGIKSVNKQGACPEAMWPYDDGDKKFQLKPSANCYSTALNNQVVSYQRVQQTLMQMKGCLAAGFPFVFGFSVYDDFYSDRVTQTGMMSLPKPNEKSEGGHA